ncbi:hypothetical protein B0O80DRAFT_425830 [Mortierella sp. GBAus27b]|nr:hypothetical protein BGX31_002204 [Mortierella sp. GBA43]KAI8355324.1 hypothetical protein B0O80DRAFT_425830 [Mortierella sp. GBAus27b]
MADNQTTIDDLQRKFMTYELAIDIYDEFLRKRTLASGADIRSVLVEPTHDQFLRVIEDFAQDPTSVAPDTEISTEPESLRALVQARRIATFERYMLIKEQLHNLGETTLF